MEKESHAKTKEQTEMSLEDAKQIIFEAEAYIKSLKEQSGDNELIGYFGVSPVYSLAASDRVALESQLSKYYSKELLKYVLITHEIVCTTQKCGNYSDSEGQYVVDIEGKFEMKEQSAQRILVQVPVKFKGINENGEFPDSYSTYTFSKSNEGYLITSISQEYNDQLYNYDNDLLVEMEEEQDTGTGRGDNMTFESYYNEKYGFELTYPKSWGISDESPSGDGIQFMQGEEINIRIYGGYLLGDDTDRLDLENARSEGKHIEEFKTQTSSEGYLITNETNDFVEIHYIVFGETIQCHLYAHVTPEFYDSNEQLLQNTAESIVVQ